MPPLRALFPRRSVAPASLAAFGFAVALLVAPFLGHAADAPGLELRPGVPVVVADDEPAPVRRAVQDLQRDLEKVLGTSSPVVRTAPGGNTPCIIVTCQSASTAAARDASLAGAEAHELRTVGQTVVLQGADVRGTIYAMYEFSQRCLGIPPFWYWLQVPVERRTAIALPANFHVRFDAPSIRYRTWFPNDTDMLHPWLDQSPGGLDAMLEALLRTKCNVLDVDYISDLPTPSRGLLWARACRDRGIMVTSTHTAPFGIRWTPGWEPYWRLVRQQEPPKLLLANQDKFWEFWRYFIALAQREHLEMLWQIAFRGDFDKKMSLTFPDAGEDAHKLAPLVERMLHDEVAFLKKVTGDPHPPMRAVMFDEVGQYYSQGLLHPPQEPSLVWTFGNDKTAMIPYQGCLDRVPPADQALGFYFNVQYTAIGSHVAEAQSPRKIGQVLSLMQSRSPRPLGELMINVGNVRDFPVGVSAGAAFAWDERGYDAAAFQRDYGAQYFGRDHAEAVARIYDGLFAAYWEPHAPQSYAASVDRQYLFTDLKTARYTEAVLQALEDGRYDPSPIKNSYWQGSVDPKYIDGSGSQLNAILVGNGVMVSRLETLDRAAEKVAAALPSTARQTFATTIGAEIKFLLAANRTLSQLIRAAQALPDRQETRRQLEAALPLAQQSAAALRGMDFGAFATWHQPAGKNGFRASDYATAVEALLQRYAQAQPLADAPLRVMSFNIRQSGAKDGPNGWTHRRDLFLDTVARFHPTLVGFQEVLADQHDDLTRRFPDYTFVGVAREDGQRRGEWALLGFRTDRFTAVDHGTFWLSETPEVIGSRSWGSAYTRICTWARLRDRATGRELLYANTHFDNESRLARTNAGQLLMERLPRLARGAPVILTGDFNMGESDPAFAPLLHPATGAPLTDSYREVHPKRSADEASFEGFAPKLAGARIDFIYHSPEFVATAAEIDRTTGPAGQLPSDHYGVTAILHLATTTSASH